MAENKKARDGGRSGRSRSIGARSRKRENAFRDLAASAPRRNALQDREAQILRQRIEELERKLNPRAMQPPRKETDA